MEMVCDAVEEQVATMGSRAITARSAGSNVHAVSMAFIAW